MSSRAFSQTDSCPVQAAEDFVARWRRADAALEGERLRRLRSLTELEAARQFARLLSPRGTYPLRASSGLVEQQRIFDRLRGKA